MEMFDSFTNILSMLFGGSVISIVTWKFARRKARAEAKQAEAEAKKAEAEAQQEKQNYYQQIIDDVVKDRDYYKQERDDLRQKLDELTRSVYEWKSVSEDERLKMKRDINMLRRQMDCIGPFLCGRKDCAIRVPVTISAEGVVDTKPVQKDIDPYDDRDNA